MYSFRQIRAAVLAGGRPSGFPYDGALDTERLAGLRAAAHLQQMLSEAREDAEHARQTPITTLTFSTFKLFDMTGSRREFERPYFGRRARLLALALVATIDQTDAPLEALEDLIWAICDEYTWCLPAHLWRDAPTPRGGRLMPEQTVDLFAAETAHALAETIIMLGGRLHPWIPERVRAEIERRVFRPLFHDPVHFHWESVPMNWASVCAGAAGMAALLLEENRERLAGMVERCCRAMECFMEGFGPDGGCAEGIGYWQYGFGYYVYFAEMLRDYTAGALDLLSGELVEKVAAFPAGVNLGGPVFVNYSDGQAHNLMHPGLLSRLANRLGSPMPELRHLPSLHADHAYRWPHVTRDLIWTDPGILGRSVEQGSRLFDHLGWVVDRRGAGDAVMAFSARAGNNGEPHNQNDLGHFILHVAGENLLADLGAGLYTRQYFGPQRYEHIHNSSEGHSVPLIDGRTQSAGAEYQAAITHYVARDDGLTCVIDLTRAYDLERLQKCERRFVWTYDPAHSTAQLVLTDSFSFDAAPSALEEIFISLHRPELSADQVVWRGAAGSVTMNFDPAVYDATLETIDSQNHQAQPIAVQRLRLRLRAPAATITVRLVFDCGLVPAGER